VKPINRHLLIKKIEQQKEDKHSAFLLPEDYKKKPQERYIAVEILDIPEDSDKFHEYHRGRTCIVESGMINEIKHSGTIYNIIGENYVVLLSGD
jgi:co-chaperonin GroES (HSP10)